MQRRRLAATIIALALVAGACGTGATVSPAATEAAMTTLTLSSPAFAAGGAIPRRHTCDGLDLSPALAWSGAPAGTAAFALIVVDPDAHGFVHWVVPAIPGDAAGLPEGVPAGGPPAQGRNDFGRAGWGGPCPPSGTHRYVFTLSALRRAPAVGANATAADLGRAIAGTVLAEATLTGTYGR